MIIKDEEKAQIKRLWDSGVAYATIIRLIPYKQVVATAMLKELRRDGTLPDRPTKGARTKAKVLELYNNGEKNPYKIASIIGCSKQTVNCCLRGLNRGKPAHNYKPTKPTEFNTLSDKTRAIVHDLKDGCKPNALVKKHNVSRQYIYVLKSKYIDKE